MPGKTSLKSISQKLGQNGHQLAQNRPDAILARADYLVETNRMVQKAKLYLLALEFGFWGPERERERKRLLLHRFIFMWCYIALFYWTHDITNIIITINTRHAE